MVNNNNSNQNQNQNQNEPNNKSSWNFNIETKNNVIENFDTTPQPLKEKLKKILNKKRRKMENPKKIPELENIFDMHPSPNETNFEPFSVSGIEGLQNNDEEEKQDGFYDPSANTDSTLTLFGLDDNSKKDTPKFTDTLKEKSKEVGDLIKRGTVKLKEYITYTYNITIGNILKTDTNMRWFVQETSNALTNKKATYYEKVVFYGQIKIFLIVLLSWVIVYNWYYVIFFLQWKDKLVEKYRFESTKLEFSDQNIINDYGTAAYALVGPSVQVVYVINKFICKTIPNKIDELFPADFSFKNIIIFVVLAFIVLSFIQYGIFSDWLSNFFTSIKGIMPIGVIPTVSLIIVAVYAAQFFFSLSIVSQLLQSGWVGFFVFLVMLLIYVLYTISVLIPLAVVLLFTYLVAYSFFAILIYKGLDVKNTFVDVSDYIASFKPETKSSCSVDETSIYDIIKEYSIKGVRYIYIYLFEIFLIYSLASGIYLYVDNYITKKATTELFTCLIIFNVLIILIILIGMGYKFNKLNAAANIPGGGAGRGGITVPKVLVPIVAATAPSAAVKPIAPANSIAAAATAPSAAVNPIAPAAVNPIAPAAAAADIVNPIAPATAATAAADIANSIPAAAAPVAATTIPAAAAPVAATTIPAAAAPVAATTIPAAAAPISAAISAATNIAADPALIPAASNLAASASNTASNLTASASTVGKLLTGLTTRKPANP